MGANRSTIEGGTWGVTSFPTNWVRSKYRIKETLRGRMLVPDLSGSSAPELYDWRENEQARLDDGKEPMWVQFVNILDFDRGHVLDSEQGIVLPDADLSRLLEFVNEWGSAGFLFNRIERFFYLYKRPYELSASGSTQQTRPFPWRRKFVRGSLRLVPDPDPLREFATSLCKVHPAVIMAPEGGESGPLVEVFEKYRDDYQSSDPWRLDAEGRVTIIPYAELAYQYWDETPEWLEHYLDHHEYVDAAAQRDDYRRGLHKRHLDQLTEGDLRINYRWRHHMKQSWPSEREWLRHSPPLPWNNDFWQHYSEPVDEYISAADDLHSIASSLLEDEARDVDALFDARRSFEALLRGVRVGVVMTERGTEAVYSFSSLIGIIAFQVFLAVQERQVARCTDPECQRLFLRSHGRKRYCGEECTDRHNTRMVRDRGTALGVLVAHLEEEGSTSPVVAEEAIVNRLAAGRNWSKQRAVHVLENLREGGVLELIGNQESGRAFKVRNPEVWNPEWTAAAVRNSRDRMLERYFRS